MVKATCGTLPPDGPTGFRMLQFHPYSEGLETRVWRLFPKVSVVTTRATARDDPRSMERTGTALRPSPGCRAMRTPTTPGADRPARANAATACAPVDDRTRGRSATRCGAAA